MRNGILLTVAALLACGGCTSVRETIDDWRVEARLGVIANPEIEWPKSTGSLRRALVWYRERKVDAVVILGNLTRTGAKNQLEVLDAAWNNVFRNAAKPPRRILVPGAKDARLAELDGFGDLKRAAEDAPYEVKGFSFYASYEKKSHPGFLTFYGAGRRALTDELGFYPRSSGAICAGSLNGVEVMRRWRAVGHPVPPKFPEVAQTVPAAQGLLVSVYADSVEIARLDFLQKTPEPVADAWRVARHVAAPAADAATTAPQFPEGAALSVIPGYSNDRALPQPILTLRWPPARATSATPRAFYYKLTAAAAATPHLPFQTLHLQSKGFAAAETRDHEALSVALRARDLPTVEGTDMRAPVVFKVTPYSSIGCGGRPLTVTVE